MRHGIHGTQEMSANCVRRTENCELRSFRAILPLHHDGIITTVQCSEVRTPGQKSRLDESKNRGAATPAAQCSAHSATSGIVGISQIDWFNKYHPAEADSSLAFLQFLVPCS